MKVSVCYVLFKEGGGGDIFFIHLFDNLRRINHTKCVFGVSLTEHMCFIVK